MDGWMDVGVPGFAAWVGIEVLGEAKPGSNVFISAAEGGVGMVAGQLAKLKGCRVIGSTGSDAKVLTHSAAIFLFLIFCATPPFQPSFFFLSGFWYPS